MSGLDAADGVHLAAGAETSQESGRNKAVISVASIIDMEAGSSLQEEDYRLHIPGLGEASILDELALDLTDEKVKSLADAPLPILPPSIILTHAHRTHCIHMLYGQLISPSPSSELKFKFQSKDGRYEAMLQLRWN